MAKSPVKNPAPQAAVTTTKHGVVPGMVTAAVSDMQAEAATELGGAPRLISTSTTHDAEFNREGGLHEEHLTVRATWELAPKPKKT